MPLLTYGCCRDKSPATSFSGNDEELARELPKLSKTDRIARIEEVIAELEISKLSKTDRIARIEKVIAELGIFTEKLNEFENHIKGGTAEEGASKAQAEQLVGGDCIKEQQVAKLLRRCDEQRATMDTCNAEVRRAILELEALQRKVDMLIALMRLREELIRDMVDTLHALDIPQGSISVNTNEH